MKRNTDKRLLLIKLLFFSQENNENGVSPYNDILLGVFRNCTDELVSTRGGWRRFPCGIGLDRKNIKKAAPRLTLMTFYFCVRRINLFLCFFYSTFHPGKELQSLVLYCLPWSVLMIFSVNRRKISLLKSLQADGTRFCTFLSDFIYPAPSAL